MQKKFNSTKITVLKLLSEFKVVNRQYKALSGSGNLSEGTWLKLILRNEQIIWVFKKRYSGTLL